MGKDSGLVIALVCDWTLQSIILVQISSSFFTKSAEEPLVALDCLLGIGLATSLS